MDLMIIYGVLIISIIVVVLGGIRAAFFPQSSCGEALRIFFHPLQRKVMDKWWRVRALDAMVYDTCTQKSLKEELLGGGGGYCVICLNEYADGERRATIVACNHRYHVQCIEEWINYKYDCPLCRSDLLV